jgi:hypothetical protein
MNPLVELMKIFNWPFCRAYSRHLGDRQADALLRFLCSLSFWAVHRYWPNFVQPHSFSEKIWHRMLHDRNLNMTLITDKLRVRDCVASKVGGNYLIPLLWSGVNAEEIPFDELPLRFVLKANHGCDYNILVNNKMQLKKEETKEQLTKWLSENFGQDTYLGIAWGYKNIKPAILVEEFIEENGIVPPDYKFWCFSGRTEIITVHNDRFAKHRVATLKRNFERHDFLFPLDDGRGNCQRPRCFDEMLEVAESLAEGYDFLRVDLYVNKDKIYFGELTPYPGGVTTKFLPVRQDFLLGEKWKI